ncbi:anti-phage deoxyguanosine triphosphatase [Granulosicoccaceae sp. 1_MG-2023]|nr:anti-phage deoxyguanosine triphosphatase [Granulosicoccaceae sp. 1_MG-2023]
MWTERHSQLKRDKKNTPTPDEAMYQRDRARIIHSAWFRSMQSKTQVLGLGESDFYRTRLTHSLEVAQIGSGLAERLRADHTINNEQREWIPSFSLIEAICLAHDIGHPPFGHGGETATNYVMREHGGFEANGQTLRILTRLGEYSENDGLDLTRRTLLGTIKYPAFHDELFNPDALPATASDGATNIDRWIPPKCIFREEEAALDWILAPFSEADRRRFRTFTAVPGAHARTQYKAFDTTIMELADDIAYGVHDMEDAIAVNLLDRHQWCEQIEEHLSHLPQSPLISEMDFYKAKLFSGSNKQRKHAISKLVGYFISNVTVAEDSGFEHPLLRLRATMSPEAAQSLSFLKKLIFDFVILRPELQALQFKGQQVIIRLFGAFTDNPHRLLPRDVRKDWLEAGEDPRVICDYIAAMTDVSAGRLYHKLFSPSVGSMFDRM